MSHLDSLKIAENSLLIYGTSNHALVVLDTVMRAANYSPCAFIDFSPRFDTFCQLPVFHESTLSEFYKREVRSIHVSLPDPNQELDIAAKAQQMGLNLVNVIDPTAVVSQSAQLGNNIFLGAQTIVGALSHLGNFSRVLNGASVAHHAKLGTGVRISDGARIAGNVFVDDRTLVGLGVTINFYLNIGKDYIVVSGASVFNDVPDSHVVRIDGNSYPRPN